jgi:hypothetical protein
MALTLVGLPVFLLHWWLAQRLIREENERYARLRAFFLYGTLLATLIPAVQNILAFLNRVWLQIFRLPIRLVFIGEGQTWGDNLVAVVINGLISFYIFTVLRGDWASIPTGVLPYGKRLKETRRLYRYIWVVYGLASIVGGIQQILYFILNLVETLGSGKGASLANGLALLVVGAPIWIYAWRTVQGVLTDEDERRSTLRLLVLYGLSLVGVAGVLIPAGFVLNLTLHLLLGESIRLSRFIIEVSGPLSAGIPFGVVWFYYGRTRMAEIAALPDTPRRASLNRVYHYILSLAGLVTVFFSLHSLLSFVLDVFLQAATWVDALRPRLSMALATLLIGLPLWYLNWRPMILEAVQDGETGDHARRSLVRKIYLYLVIFAGVIGVMGSGGSLLFQVLSKLLGDPLENFQRASWILLELFLLFAGILIYHLATLRVDGRMAAQTLTARHQQFPVLVLVPEMGDFSEEILDALQRETPSLPIAVHTSDLGVPDETLSDAKAVILPGTLAAEPNEAIRIWLKAFDGHRLVVPTETKNWLWAFGSGRSLSNLANQTAKMIRYLAEGEELPQIRETSPWTIILYVLAGLTAVPLLIGFFSALGDILY